MRPKTLIRRLRSLAAVIAAPLVLMASSGCFNPFDPQVRGVGITEPPPVPDSPSSLLRRLEWCYVNRAIFEYRELFDDNYRFVFGQRDPDGNAYRTNPWIREDEVQSTTHLFQGGDANQPAAASITLLLDRNFRVTEDPDRPGRAHKLIRTRVTIKLTAVDQTQREVEGFANFFLVRGDSASIPEELRQRGFEPDSNRWYILRHEDDTYQEPEGASSAPLSRLRPATGAVPASTAWVISSSWGALKFAYR